MDQEKSKGNKPKILVSACLLGIPCRYDGRSKPNDLARGLQDCFDVVPVCPEKSGGLVTPRTPSEQRVIDGDVRVVSSDGEDRTAAFQAGTDAVLAAAKKHGAQLAVLKAKSPSCGTELIYDGTFSGALIAGSGMAAKALRENGVAVFSEYSIPLLNLGLSRVKAFQDYEQLAALEQLYLEAFPPEEIMPLSGIMEATADGRATMYVYEQDGKPVAMAYLLEGDGIQYLLYLAVSAAGRGKGVGSAVLADLRNVCRGVLALDIETLDDLENCPNADERLKRLSFYQKNGFEPSGFQITDAGITYDNLCRGGKPDKEAVVSTLSSFYASIGEAPDVC